MSGIEKRLSTNDYSLGVQRSLSIQQLNICNHHTHTQETCRKVKHLTFSLK